MGDHQAHEPNADPLGTAQLTITEDENIPLEKFLGMFRHEKHATYWLDHTLLIDLNETGRLLSVRTKLTNGNNNVRNEHDWPFDVCVVNVNESGWIYRQENYDFSSYPKFLAFMKEQTALGPTEHAGTPLYKDIPTPVVYRPAFKQVSRKQTGARKVGPAPLTP
jgi:hypothetical protein